MKSQFSRLLSAVAFMAGILFAVSCERADFDKMPEFVKNINVTVEDVDFSAVSDPQSKVDYTVNGSKIDFSWSDEGDVVGIYPIGGDQVAFPLSSSSGASANFDGGSWALRTSFRYAAYYPFTKDYYGTEATSLPISYVGQKQVGDNSLDHLSPYSFMASMATSPDSKGNVSINLKHIGAWVQIRAVAPLGMKVGKAVLKDKTGRLVIGGKMDLTQTAANPDAFVPVMKDPVYASSITLDVENVEGTGDILKFWMMLPPQDLTGHELELTIQSVGNGASSTSTIQGKNLPRAVPTVLKFNDAYDGYTPSYLCFTTVESSASVALMKEGVRWTGTSPQVEYSRDGVTWTPVTLGQGITIGSSGSSLMFRGDNASFSESQQNYLHFKVNGKVAASGNVMTLVDRTGLSTVVPNPYAFCNLFLDCDGLTTAPDLPATTLTPHCYHGMFAMCNDLTEAPFILAANRAERCYEGMFKQCSNLKAISVGFTDWGSEMQATYDWLSRTFPQGRFICPPALEVIADDGQGGNATISYVPGDWEAIRGDGATGGQENVDYFCLTALTPASQVGVLAGGTGYAVPTFEYSYDGRKWYVMSYGNLYDLEHEGDRLYLRGDNETVSCGTDRFVMFEMTGKIAAGGNILTLVDRRGLKNTVDHDYEFACLFKDCRALAVAPALPATSLTTGCYEGMFKNCTSLVSAPALPAAYLVRNCYKEMFSGCSNLKSANVSFVSWEEYCGATDDWMSGVPAGGRLRCPASLSSVTDASHVPSGWIIDYPDDKYLTFVPNDNVTLNKVSLVIEGNSANLDHPIVLEYKTDNMPDWQTYTGGEIEFLWPNSLHFRGNNSTFSKNSSNYARFVIHGDVDLKGNIMTLLDKTGASITIPTAYCFYGLFSNPDWDEDDGLSGAHGLELPAYYLKPYCYSYLFANRTQMWSVPVIPDAQMAEYCYAGVFSGCQAIVDNGPGTDGLTVNVTGIIPTGCFNYAFEECWSVSKITVEFDNFGIYCTNSWLDATGDVAETSGETLEFWCNSRFYNSLQFDNRDYHSVPENWVVH